MKEMIEYECLVCGHHIKSDSLKRKMCSECGNGIYAPVSTLVLEQRDQNEYKKTKVT